MKTKADARHREIEHPEVVPVGHSKLCLLPNITVSHFEYLFGKGGEIRLAEAPGRVNLIGDHTDYNGLPVFPMAVQRRFRILFRPRHDAPIRAATLDGYAERSFTIATEIEPYEQGDWGNYVKASARILAQRYGDLRGMDMLLHSDIPVAAGLSSSSALVVGSGIALLAANQYRSALRRTGRTLSRRRALRRHARRRHGSHRLPRRPGRATRSRSTSRPSRCTRRPCRPTGASSSVTAWCARRSRAR